MNKINISHVDNMHSQWLRNLNFYKTELSILKGILTEISGKNTNRDMQVEVEHFENQFKIQTNNIDTVSHEIHVNISKIAAAARSSSAGYIDGNLLSEHTHLGRKAEDEEVAVRDVIKSFRKFAEKWM